MEEKSKINNLEINNIPQNTAIQKQPIMEGELTGYPSIDKPWLKYYSEEAKNAKIEDLTLYQALVKESKNHPNAIAVDYYGTKISYKELIENIDKAAKSLQSLNIKKNDVISLCTVNLPETLYLFFAINKLGAIANIIDPRINKDQILDFVNKSNSKYLFAIDLCLPKIELISDKLKVKTIYKLSANESLPKGLKVLKSIKDKMTKTQKLSKSFKVYDWKDFINNGENEQLCNPVINEKDQIAEIVYTTGTTGTPKGAVLTNQNILAMRNEQIWGIPSMEVGKKFLGIMPPFIAYGSVWGTVIPLLAGLELIIIPKFDVEIFDKLVVKNKPNYLMGVPSHYEKLIKSKLLNNEDLSYLNAVIAGGNAMTPTFEKKLNKFLEEHNCNISVTKGYGMTEVSSAFSYPISKSCNKVGSVGIPLSKNNIKILDVDTKEELKYNQKGLLQLNGPTVILGYYNNEEETKKVFSEKKEDLYKWVNSGDIGYIDEDGCLFITGRSKRTLIRADGHNVFPGEIENVITMHDAVESCCVVGVPSVEYENAEVPTAFVVLKEEFKGYEDQIELKLKEFCLKYLQQRDVAQEYRFIEQMPLIDGKIDFRKVEQIGLEQYNLEKQKVFIKK